MIINTVKPNYETITQELVVVFAFEDKESRSYAALEAKHRELLSTLTEKKRLKTDLGASTPLIGIVHSLAENILVVGCGKAEAFNEIAFVNTIKTIATHAKTYSISSVSIDIDDIKPVNRSAQWASEKTIEVIFTELYQYDATKSKKADPASLTEINLMADEQNLDLAVKTGKAIAHGKNLARELGNLPANICDPAYLAEQAVNLADAYDEIDVQIIDEPEIEAMGMGAFMAVTRASEKNGKIIIMKYNGGSADQKPHVLVGKGLTFDSGGISIKPAAGMEEMKWDMLGAASVFGTMSAIAELKPAINVIGVVATAENMISGAATRPGDVVTCMNGKTVEIINTDAEGRLVLCDTLTYVERFQPASVVDIATLTGAVIIGLGHHATAVYANDDDLQQQLLSAGNATWDKGWPMPLWQEYNEDLKSPYADFRNVGSRAAGSITAAVYLSEFAKAYKWAHLDIAGTGWSSAKEGASGRPVAMLTQYLLDRLA